MAQEQEMCHDVEKLWKWNIPVKQIDWISSLSSMKAILSWPRPIVYFPALTPSKVSISVWSTHYTWQKKRYVSPLLSKVGQLGSSVHFRVGWWDRAIRQLAITDFAEPDNTTCTRKTTYARREVHINAKDTNILGIVVKVASSTGSSHNYVWLDGMKDCFVRLFKKMIPPFWEVLRSKFYLRSAIFNFRWTDCCWFWHSVRPLHARRCRQHIVPWYSL